MRMGRGMIYLLVQIREIIKDDDSVLTKFAKGAVLSTA